MKSAHWMCLSLVLLAASPAWSAEEARPESAEETIHRLEAEIRALRSTVASLVKENRALKAEVSALRSGKAGIDMQVADAETLTTATSANPPANLAELLAAGRAYVVVVPGETSAARQTRQAKAMEPLAGREFVLQGILENIWTTKESNLLWAKVKYESARTITYEAVVGRRGIMAVTADVTRPAEIVTVNITIADEGASELRKGTRVTVRGQLTEVGIEGVAEGKGLRMTIKADKGKIGR